MGSSLKFGVWDFIVNADVLEQMKKWEKKEEEFAKVTKEKEDDKEKLENEILLIKEKNEELLIEICNMNADALSK